MLETFWKRWFHELHAIRERVCIKVRNNFLNSKQLHCLPSVVILLSLSVRLLLTKNGCTHDPVEWTITTTYDDDSQGEKEYRSGCVQRDVSHRTELLYLLLLWLSPKLYFNVMFGPQPVSKTYIVPSPQSQRQPSQKGTYSLWSFHWHANRKALFTPKQEI